MLPQQAPPESVVSLATPYIAGAVVCVLVGIVLMLYVRLKSARAANRVSILSDTVFDAFFGDAEVGVAVIDEQGAIVRTNNVFEAMTGYLNPTLIGTLYVDLVYDPTDATIRDRVVGALDRFGEARTLTIRRSNGTFFRARFMVSPAPAALSRTQSVIYVEEVGPDKDRSESDESDNFGRSPTPNSRKRSFAKSGKQPMGNIDSDEADFLAVLSDEFRTPLTVIMGNVAMLGEELGNEYDGVTSAIMESSNRLADKVESLLYYARLQVDSIAIEPRPVNVTSIVEEIAGIFKHRASDQNLELTLATPWKPVHAVVDPVCVRKVVFNLIENALKFTDEGVISISVAKHAGSVVFCVSDTGLGFDNAVKASMFDSFYQASAGSTRKVPGVGLGLAIVRELVEKQGGKIAVASKEGEGTTFMVRIPDSAIAYQSGLGLAA